MRLVVLGSSSSGNGYILRDSEGNSLMLEAGVNPREVKKAMEFDLSQLHGCLVSHIHSDHSKYSKRLMTAGIEVYAGDESGLSGHRYNPIKAMQQVNIGPFKIKPFPLVHDVQTFGFLINHEECGKTCFITDTAYCQYSFPGLNNIIIEANYCQDIMMQRFLDGSLNAMVRDRTMKSHMSFQSTLEFLKANDLKEVNNIVLIHLSSGNADPETFRTKTVGATGKTVTIASPGIEIELNKNPLI